MRYKWLLFDADNTFLDFASASKNSLFQTLDEYNLDCDEEIYKIYKTENAKVWESFENKEITALELRSLRFAKFFSAVDIGGIDPFQFNAHYLQNLVHLSEAYDGAIDLLEALMPQYTLSVITNGLKEVQRPRINKLSMNHIFESIIVSDEIGVAKPDIRFFEHSYNSITNPPPKSEVLVIGDNLKSDILGGVNFGVDTCWISHENENESSIQPTYTINSVLDIHSVL
ncbi:MAG: pyrimidine 5'-nucleotidase [Saprospiraceae bacterium]|nr:pyrimidine 5'-nucleotidase [Saprospiraceae bacterium]